MFLYSDQNLYNIVCITKKQMYVHFPYIFCIVTIQFYNTDSTPRLHSTPLRFLPQTINLDDYRLRSYKYKEAGSNFIPWTYLRDKSASCINHIVCVVLLIWILQKNKFLHLVEPCLPNNENFIQK